MYKIVGADQKEYGPVTEEQLRQWITDGRANAQTIARLGDGPWKPLSTFPEFASLFPAAPVSSMNPSNPPPPVSIVGGGAGGAISTNGMAIAGLICSIVGLFCCGPIFSTVGLVLSAIGLSQINQNPSRFEGKGIALAGIVLALVGYVLFAILLFSGLFKEVFRHLERGF